jgi:hypothetical protein
MAPADEARWPLASSPERARWAAQAVERYLHMARMIMTRAAAWPAGQGPFSAQALDLARQLCDAIERRVDELGRPPRPDVLCAHCGARPFFPSPPVPDEGAWPAISNTCGIVGRVSAGDRWTDGRLECPGLPSGDRAGGPARTGS